MGIRELRVLGGLLSVVLLVWHEFHICKTELFPFGVVFFFGMKIECVSLDWH